MGYDTYSEIWNKVKLRCPVASALLCRDWINEALRVIQERRQWSWQIKKGQILLSDEYDTGTVTVTRGSTTVEGAGTVWTDANTVGRAFTSGSNNPVYIVASRTDGDTLELDQAWGGATAAGASYSIFDAYHTPPVGFLSFVSVWDPSKAFQLHLNIQQEQLNSWDPQRSNSSHPYVVAWHSYDDSTPPKPRYEVWPHYKSDYVLPYLYVARLTDESSGDLDEGGSLPRTVRGDILMTYALSEAAVYPGPDSETRNPFSSEWRARYYLNKFEKQLAEMERNDDELFERMISYATDLPYAPLMDADWMQSHGGEAWL